jgi:hypothetical protein
MHCENLCKCHNVPSASTIIKENKVEIKSNMDNFHLAIFFSPYAMVSWVIQEAQKDKVYYTHRSLKQEAQHPTKGYMGNKPARSGSIIWDQRGTY